MFCDFDLTKEVLNKAFLVLTLYSLFYKTKIVLKEICSKRGFEFFKKCHLQRKMWKKEHQKLLKLATPNSLFFFRNLYLPLLLCRRLRLMGFLWCSTPLLLEKQPTRGVLRKRCSENMQQIYRGTPCIFSEFLFLRTPLSGCFCRYLDYIALDIF